MASSLRTTKRQRLDPLLVTVDEIMEKRCWSPTQIQSMARFQEQQTAQWQSALDHVVDVPWSSWDFLEHSPWRSSWEALGVVRDEEPTSRRQLVDLAEACRERDDWVPLLLATFAWGMGTTGYGPARLKAILHWGDSSRRRVDDLNLVLSAAVQHLLLDPVHAYAYLRGQNDARYGTAGGVKRVPGWGPAFFTKFLYFASAALLPQSPRPALILDMRVAQTLRRLTHEGLAFEGPSGLRIAQNSKVTADELAKWAWADGGWWAGRYMAYLDYVLKRQRELQQRLPSWPHDPAMLEVALWRRYPNTAGRESGHIA